MGLVASVSSHFQISVRKQSCLPFSSKFTLGNVLLKAQKNFYLKSCKLAFLSKMSKIRKGSLYRFQTFNSCLGNKFKNIASDFVAKQTDEWIFSSNDLPTTKLMFVCLYAWNPTLCRVNSFAFNDFSKKAKQRNTKTAVLFFRRHDQHHWDGSTFKVQSFHKNPKFATSFHSELYFLLQ